MKKDLAIIAGLVLVIVIFIIFGRGFSTGQFLTQNATESAQVQTKESTQVTVKDLVIKVKIADEPKEQQTGLADNSSLALDEGMMFVFDQSKRNTFWMKDMKFAIDIIWIDDQKKIVDIAPNVPPEPNKDEKKLTRYKPKSDAKYVLEINAGLSALHNLQIGDQVAFEL